MRNALRFWVYSGMAKVIRKSQEILGYTRIKKGQWNGSRDEEVFQREIEP